MRYIIKITFLLLGLFPVLSVAQNSNKLIREGNAAYEDKKYDQSELKYRRSLEKDKNSSIGVFNLGDALYKQEKYEEAEDKFRQALTLEQSKDKKQLEEAKIYHNLGNSLLKQEKYEESINEYKNALKKNPDDADTKYNLSYARKMLKQQQQQNQQNQDQQQNKDQQKQDQKKEDQQQEKKQQDDHQQQQNAEQNEQRKEEQRNEQMKPGNLTKEEAEKMLDALRNDERDLQKKIKRAEPVRGTIEKNW